jgi:hypothetical protein
MDIAMTFVAITILTGVVAILASGHPRSMRPWVWYAFVEYLVCGAGEFILNRTEHGDASYYRDAGIQLASFLDTSFGWASREVMLLLLQQPSAFDTAILGAGSNTGSMCAAVAWIMFFVRSSEYAAQAVAAGLALCGALAIYNAFRDACPEAKPLRLFIATVMFPSVAFWTSALHKESVCLMGTGLLFAAWRAAYKRQFRALFYGPVGVVLILMFRAPALPPFLIGLVAYFVVDRLRKTRGAEATIVGPVYFALGLGMMALGMVLVSRVAPDLALDRLSTTVALQQRAWIGIEGGSNFGNADDALAQGTAAQVLHAPLALVNALFRPQLFDVGNPLVLVSALEMTALTYFIIRAVRRERIGGILTRIQRSPFLLMCTIITVVGCTFVGLTTKNLGSLARYRVPFLPFYGALIAVLMERAAVADAPTPVSRVKTRCGPRRRAAPTVPT